MQEHSKNGKMREKGAGWRQALACALAGLGLLVAFAAQAAGVCGSSSSSGPAGAVFSTLSGGRLTASTGAAGNNCTSTFYNSSILNAQTGYGVNTPTSAACLNASNGAKMALSGNNGKSIALPTFQTVSPSTLASSYMSYDAAWGWVIASSASPSGSYWAIQTNSAQAANWFGRALTIPARSSTTFTVPSDVYADWGWLDFSDGASMTFKANATGDVHIDRISSANCGSGTLTFTGPETYWVNQWQVAEGCDIAVVGGPVTLYINQTASVGGATTQTCVNWTGTCGATPTAAIMAAQHPENLKIYSYGAFSATNANMAAGVYSASQSVITGSANNKMAFAGELVGSAITYDTGYSSDYAYMSTGMFATTATASARQGFYQLSSPALPPLAKTGDLAYLAQQQDVDSTGAKAMAGHLFAHAIQADGSIAASPTWDAAANMTTAQRTASLYTVGATGALIKLSTAQSNLALLPTTVAAQMAVNGSNAIGALINPNYQSGIWLAGRDSASLMGRPLRSAPFVAGQAVVVGSEDGFLYGFDKTTGALLWGFIPPELLPSTLTAGALVGTNPWGQGSVARSGGSLYVLATAMQGAVHVSLKLNADGTLAALGWEDYQAGLSSPASPVGGAAPTVAVDQTGAAAGKAAYVVNNVLKRVSVANGSGAALTTLPTTATSNLVYLSDTAAYYGDSAGAIKGVLGAANVGSLSETPTSPVLWLTGAYQQTSASPSLVLIGASGTKASVFSVGAASSTLLWQFSSASTTGAPNLPASSLITAMPTVSGGLVYLGYTTGTDFCAQTGYEVGPLTLLTGQPAISDSTFRAASLATAVSTLGAGEALFAPAATLNGKAMVFADANGGAAASSTGWGAFKPTTLDKSAENKRLDWRELTQFIVGWWRGAIQGQDAYSSDSNVA